MSSLQLGQLGVSGDSLSEAALRAVFSDLHFESNVTPRIHIRDPFGPANPSAVGRAVQPKVTLTGPLVGKRILAPWGEPNPASFPLTALVLGLGLAGLGYYAWSGIRC